jgi:putative SOS response-associated peptidase YedK
VCVSGQIESRLRKLEREYEAVIDWSAWGELFELRTLVDLKIPKAIEANFDEPKTSDEIRIKKAIDVYREKKSAAFEQELFKQKKRLGDAERLLKTKTTKKAIEDVRIATNKIDDLVRRISDLKRTELLNRDSLFFPYYYAPIIISRENQRTIIPARYLCRPAGKPAFYDTKYPGCFNARRDNLEGFWKGQFGKEHAVAVISSFYENVPLHKYEHRELREDEKETNVLLHFNPQPTQNMIIASLWSHWTGKDGEQPLNSFAMITDEPSPEVAAAGHDRTVAVIKDSNLSAWLSVEGTTTEAMYRILDDVERPYFEHRQAA